MHPGCSPEVPLSSALGLKGATSAKAAALPRNRTRLNMAAEPTPADLLPLLERIAAALERAAPPPSRRWTRVPPTPSCGGRSAG
ncbi:hypothetical protein GCM10025880_18420 [Methylorubrum aminovorans]|nr:hypothetical protein GCM10025880_18420 [Methylorubrum aminovorans]